MLQQHSEAAISQLRANPDELLDGVQWCAGEGEWEVTCRRIGSSGQEITFRSLSKVIELLLCCSSFHTHGSAARLRRSSHVGLQHLKVGTRGG